MIFKIDEMIWIIPVIFIIHDLEEIIWVKQWIKQKQSDMLAKRNKPFAGFAGTESFAFAVLEELVIIVLICIYTSLSDNYIIWYGVLFVIVIHFAPHIFSVIVYKGYVPGSMTAILLLPFGIYMLYSSIQLFNYKLEEIIISCTLCALVFLLNLFWLHKMMPKFDKIINK